MNFYLNYWGQNNKFYKHIKKTIKMEKKEKKTKEKKPLGKEKVCEIFKVEKDKEEKIIKTCGTEEKKPATKEQINEQNKILRNVLILSGAVILVFLIGYFIINSIRHFEYEGVKFDVVKESDIIFYKTSIPVLYQGKIVPYNFYMRKDPRKLDDVAFEGEIVFLKEMVVNITEDFNCDGDGIIAIANLVNLYGVLGTNVIKDENATCDSEGRYVFMQIQPGDETSIEQVGPACYNLNVNNCEILEVTEKFMIETFIEFNKLNK